MSSVQYLREFVNERLSAAAEEIFGVLEKTIVEYEEEVDRQRRLLDIVWRPEIKLHRIELPQQEEVLTDQQLWNQERNSSLDQEEPEPLQVRGEQEEICTSQEGEQLGLKKETETFMLTPDDEEPDHSEPEPDRDHQLLSDNCRAAESQDQEGGKHMDSGSTTNAESKTNKRYHKNRSHSKKVYNSSISKSNSNHHTDKMSLKGDTCGKAFKYQSEIRKHLRTHTGEKPPFLCLFLPPEVPQQHVCKEEEEVLADQQLWDQERNSSLDQEQPEPLQIKGEQEEICTSQEGEQLDLKQETETFMLTPDDEEPDHSEPEPDRDHQLLSDNCPAAESQDQEGGKHVDSTRNPESKPQKRPHKNRSHSKKVNNSPTSKFDSDIHTGGKSFECNARGKSFCFKSGLNKHKKSHTAEKPHSCEACDKGFRYRSDLLTHMRTHTGKWPYLCKTCGKDLGNRAGFVSHMKTHRDEKSHLCKCCGKTLRNRAGFVTHMRTHTGKWPYLCKTCGKTLRNRAGFVSHMKTHTGKKPYSGETREKIFKNISLLTRPIHTGEKPYICKICAKGFLCSSALKVHTRTHTGEKPHSCNTCGKRFNYPSDLKRHIRTHSGIRTHSTTYL